MGPYSNRVGLASFRDFSPSLTSSSMASALTVSADSAFPPVLVELLLALPLSHKIPLLHAESQA